MTSHKTIEGAARLVGLAPDDLRARLDAAQEVIADGLRLVRRGSDLVEIERASGSAVRE